MNDIHMRIHTLIGHIYLLVDVSRNKRDGDTFHLILMQSNMISKLYKVRDFMRQFQGTKNDAFG